jgi:hypothetical protein
MNVNKGKTKKPGEKPVFSVSPGLFSLRGTAWYCESSLGPDQYDDCGTLENVDYTIDY